MLDCQKVQKCQGWNPGDGSYRGKEIYDPASDAWYWLDTAMGEKPFVMPASLLENSYLSVYEVP